MSDEAFSGDLSPDDYDCLRPCEAPALLQEEYDDRADENEGSNRDPATTLERFYGGRLNELLQQRSAWEKIVVPH